MHNNKTHAPLIFIICIVEYATVVLDCTRTSKIGQQCWLLVGCLPYNSVIQYCIILYCIIWVDNIFVHKHSTVWQQTRFITICLFIFVVKTRGSEKLTLFYIILVLTDLWLHYVAFIMLCYVLQKVANLIIGHSYLYLCLYYNLFNIMILQIVTRYILLYYISRICGNTILCLHKQHFLSHIYWIMFTSNNIIYLV